MTRKRGWTQQDFTIMEVKVSGAVRNSEGWMPLELSSSRLRVGKVYFREGGRIKRKLRRKDFSVSRERTWKTNLTFISGYTRLCIVGKAKWNPFVVARNSTDRERVFELGIWRLSRWRFLVSPWNSFWDFVDKPDKGWNNLGVWGDAFDFCE